MKTISRVDSLLACLMVGVACGESGGSAGRDAGGVPESERYGGTVVVGYKAEASSMNALASIDENSSELQTHVLFTTLIRYDEELRPRPYLAESWDTATVDGAFTLTFRLRSGVRWHDGRPVTARDVAFTFDRATDPATAYPKSAAFSLYDSVAVRDSLTLTFYLEPHPGFLDPWRLLPPMPEHLLGDVPPEALATHPFGTRQPVGHGPFRFVEHRTGDRWVFEANPDFPDALGGRPYVDRLIYRIVPEATTLLSEFLSGDVDVYILATPAQVAEIEARPGRRVLTYPSRSYTFIAWNGRRPYFRSAEVRRALTLAIDREQIVRSVAYGLGRIAVGPVPPFHWAHHDGLEPLPHDPDRARALLEGAGWVDRDGDGVRERDGRPFAFELKTHPHPVRQDIMTLVQADLAEVGIDVRTRVLEAQSFAGDIMGPERRFDAFVLGWSPEFRLDDRQLFACSARTQPFGWAGYCDPRVDSLLSVVARVQDRSETLPLWHEYQETMQRDQPFTVLYYELAAHGLRERIRNVRMDVRGQLRNVADWWIAPSDRRLEAGGGR